MLWYLAHEDSEGVEIIFRLIKEVFGIYIDLFPRTDKSYKILWTCFHERRKPIKTTIDLFPRTEK